MSTAAEEQGNKALEALRQLKGGAMEVRLDLLLANNNLQQFIGEARGLKSLSLVADAMMIGKLKMVRDSKLYKAALDPESGGNVKSFERFCQMIGMAEHTVNEQIRVADRLGAQFLQLQMTGGLGLKREHVRMLLAAPSDVQAEATGVAVAMARGEDVAQRLAALEDRIEDLTESQADKMKLIEQRVAADDARGQAEDKAKTAEEKAKNETKKRQAIEADLKKAREEVDTPPKLRTPEQARMYVARALGYGEAIGGLVEEATDTLRAQVEHAVQHARDKGTDPGAAFDAACKRLMPFIQHLHDVCNSTINRLFMAYTYLCDFTGSVDEEARPMMAAMMGIFRGDAEMCTVARGVVEKMRAEAEACSPQDAEGSGHETEEEETRA